MQQDARDDLKMFSQARGERSLAALPGYAYDVTIPGAGGESLSMLLTRELIQTSQ